MSPALSLNSVRSWPTQKPRPAPVITTARTSSARAAFRAAPSSFSVEAFRAFSTSGRFSVIVRTAPSRAVSTSATRASLKDAPQADAPLLAWPDDGADLHRLFLRPGRRRTARCLLEGGYGGCRAPGAFSREPEGLATGAGGPPAGRRRQCRGDHSRRVHPHFRARDRADRRRAGVVRRRARARIRG